MKIFRNQLFLQKTSSSNNEIKINFYDQKSAKNAYELLSKKSSYIMSQSENLVTIKLSDEFISDTKKKLLSQVKDDLSNRIDQFGVVESSVQLSGQDRIVIQIPGVDSRERERILGIISKTAMMEFKPVIEQSPSKEFLISKYKLKDNKNSFSIYQTQDNPKEKDFIITKSRASFSKKDHPRS